MAMSTIQTLTDITDDKIRVSNQLNLYEDDLYFLSQMFEKDWIPRDTIIDYDGGTVGNVPLRRFNKGKH